MRSGIHSVIGSVLVLTAASATGHAAFVEIDDFEALGSGTINGVNGWTVSGGGGNNAVVADPADAGNLVLAVSGASENNIKAAVVADGNTGTLFFRFRTLSQTTPDISIGLSPLIAPVNGTDISSTLRINGSSLQVYDGAFQTVGSIATGTWYSVWMVVNNNVAGDKSFEVFVQGGAYASQSQLSYSGDSSFAFRLDPAGAFNAFDARSNTAHSTTVYFDDIYLDASSRNLATVPEPASMGLLGAASLMMLKRRRR